MCYFYFLPRSEVEVIGGSDSNLKFELSRIELRFHLFFETKLISLCYDISFFKEGRLLRIFWTRTWLFIDFLDLSLKNRIFYFIVHHQRDYEIVKEANFFPNKKPCPLYLIINRHHCQMSCRSHQTQSRSHIFTSKPLSQYKCIGKTNFAFCVEISKEKEMRKNIFFLVKIEIFKIFKIISVFIAKYNIILFTSPHIFQWFVADLENF